jgi:hypothetical protein
MKDGRVEPRRDLPGYSETQETEALGLFVVQNYLVRSGFKVTEINGRFDDGLDLLVSPHNTTNVLPAIAGIQVRSGSSHQGLKVGRHEAYWRELNLPVFGVVITDPKSNPPDGTWCNAQAYLRTHSDVRIIPTPNHFPDGLVEAVQAGNEGQRSLAAALDVFSDDWQRQAGAVAKLVPLASDSRVIEMLCLRLPGLGPRATQYALHLLVMAEAEDVDSRISTRQVADAIEKLHGTDASGWFDVEAYQDGTGAAYDLLEIRNTDPGVVLDEALQSRFSESPIMLIAMAVSLAGPYGESILEEALRRKPNLGESPDIIALADSIAEGGYHFSW